MAKTRFLGTVEVPKAQGVNEAVNYGQVKEMIDRHMKEPVKVATTGELTGTYADGVFTLSADLNKVDNVVLAEKDAILVKDQMDKTQNGVYIVTNLGTTGTPSEATATTTSTTITGVNVDVALYEVAYTTSETLTYADATTTWTDSTGVAVDLATIGITIEGTATDADVINISYTPAVSGNGGELTRREDFTTGKVILNNTFVNVMEGDTNGDTRWTIVGDGVLTVDASTIIFVKDIDTADGSINVVKATITGDDTSTTFNVAHNLNLTDTQAYMLIVKDAQGNDVVVNNAPTLGNEANAITLEFTVAPEVAEGDFKVFIIGLE